MAPKIRIEDTLPSGEKITITLEGPSLSKTRVLQILDLLKIMSGEVGGAEQSTLKERIWSIIKERFGGGEWFTIRDVHQALTEFEPGIRISTVATYITRFVAEGRLIKRGRRPTTRYRVRAAIARV
ncbi:MAG: hypothetical protein DRJ96_05625 [Thermoprotei archaeon]|nr:MAG: hypothetical protein DRJ96_05625 [Thermoprotei archaeon]